MSSEIDYPPGTVAVATVRSQAGVRVMRTTEDSVHCWMSTEQVRATRFHHQSNLRDIRPLAVIDPTDGPKGSDWLWTRWLREAAWTCDRGGLSTQAWVLRQFHDMIIDQVTFPPPVQKPDEPTGLGAVVKEGDLYWVRGDNNRTDVWERDGMRRSWEMFADDIEIISKGVVLDG